ncbi:conserved hypothetical protein [Candidatus Accumulibacter aalborgensis]|uniref:Peptidase metallopeptidase domain-containing protein n=1 Tax=Candidatus Accumulibacter aalborgensis TaxID=1860102 RepID=A0A1A8XDM1_9PROT|nr:matrixin [Candidatus Accumulibacter aalborgensis]SBT03295.1 conserved hypothetical protein [Candidatus Accumulibacter aalborgensis]
MATVSDLNKASYSGNYQVDALLQPLVANWNYLLPSRTTLYYTFDCSLGSVIDQNTSEILTMFTAEQRSAAASILGYVGSLTGISFAETASGTSADLHFGAIDVAGASTSGLTHSTSNYSYTNGQVLTGYSAEAFVYLDNVEFASTNASPTPGSAGYETLLHEIGHALGLSHPFEGPRALPAAEDNTNNTVMSYTRAGDFKSTFQAYDLLALTWIFGKDGLGGSYGYNSSHGPSLTPEERLPATAGNDRLTGQPGNESIDGLGGIDTISYQGVRSNYALKPVSGGFQLIALSGQDGIDTLINVERVEFADTKIALDLDGNAGKVARILGAVFGSSAVSNKEYAGIGLQLLDQGMSYEALNGLAISVTGKNTAAEVVDLLWTNVVNSPPSPDQAQPFIDLLNGGMSFAALGVLAADTELNRLNIDLVGLSSTGLEYV